MQALIRTVGLGLCGALFAFAGPGCGSDDSSGGSGGSTSSGGTKASGGSGGTSAGGTSAGGTSAGGSTSGGTGGGTAGSTSGGGGSAGGSGANTCENYCAIYKANCKAALYLYADDADCMAKCATFAAGDPGATSGDTLACRIYHATAAGGSEPGSDTTHCPHAGENPTAFCK